MNYTKRLQQARKYWKATSSAVFGFVEKIDPFQSIRGCDLPNEVSGDIGLVGSGWQRKSY